MKESISLKKGLTGFDLKTIALVLMVLDHIHYFFEFTGKVPLVFTWLGRLSAPLFLFCVVEGFIHTHNRKRYLLVIYAISVVMGALQYAFIMFGIQRPDGFYPRNQILANFAILIIILQGIDWISKKEWKKGLVVVLLPILWAVVVMVISRLVPSFSSVVGILHYTFFPILIAIQDGGAAYIFLGVLLYLLRNNRKAQAIAMFVEPLVTNFATLFLFFPGLTFTEYFTVAFEWMSAFAGIFLLFYNGQRGKGSKQFFYWFYPGHVYVLFALSWILYLLIH